MIYRHYNILHEAIKLDKSQQSLNVRKGQCVTGRDKDSKCCILYAAYTTVITIQNLNFKYKSPQKMSFTASSRPRVQKAKSRVSETLV